MDFAEIIYDKKDRVATVTMNRPEKMNAWTPKMGAEMRTAMLDAERDPAIGAIIVTGAGLPHLVLVAAGAQHTGDWRDQRRMRRAGIYDVSLPGHSDRIGERADGIDLHAARTRDRARQQLDAASNYRPRAGD